MPHKCQIHATPIDLHTQSRIPRPPCLQEGVPYQRSLHFPPHYAGKLSVAHTYNGHSGCVNRLAWNADGSLLVSGSDDRRVRQCGVDLAALGPKLGGVH